MNCLTLQSICAVSNKDGSSACKIADGKSIVDNEPVSINVLFGSNFSFDVIPVVVVVVVVANGPLS